MASRIRAFYECLPEASQSVPCVDPDLANHEGPFEGPAMKSVHRFALSVGGGSGLSHADQLMMARMLHKVESVASDGHGGAVTEAFPSAESFAGGLAREQDRVLAVRGWMEVVIDTAVGAFTFYHRGLFEVGLGTVMSAERLNLDGGRLRPSPEGWTRRSRTMDRDLFLEEDRTVRRIHGKDARVLLTTLHADEALVSWSGA